MTTIRLTMAQALIRHLAAQTSEVDGREVPLFAGVFAIFGHGNVAGVGEALYDARERLPTLRAHNEQAMGLAAIAFAKANRRRRMMACTSSSPLPRNRQKPVKYRRNAENGAVCRHCNIE